MQHQEQVQHFEADIFALRARVQEESVAREVSGVLNRKKNMEPSLCRKSGQPLVSIYVVIANACTLARAFTLSFSRSRSLSLSRALTLSLSLSLALSLSLSLTGKRRTKCGANRRSRDPSHATATHIRTKATPASGCNGPAVAANAFCKPSIFSCYSRHTVACGKGVAAVAAVAGVFAAVLSASVPLCV
jgi:hypothetical protein